MRGICSECGQKTGDQTNLCTACGMAGHYYVVDRPDPDLCIFCGLPLSQHRIGVGFYTQPDGSEKDYEGYLCPEPTEADLQAQAEEKEEALKRAEMPPREEKLNE